MGTPGAGEVRLTKIFRSGSGWDFATLTVSPAIPNP